jgi:hypothetical protein
LNITLTLPTYLESDREIYGLEGIDSDESEEEEEEGQGADEEREGMYKINK